MAFDCACYWCDEPLEFAHCAIDHVIAEVTPAKTLTRIRALYALNDSFAVNSFENWVPAHTSCNSKKATLLEPRPSPAMVTIFRDISRRADTARKIAQRAVSEKQRGKILAQLTAAIEQGLVQRSDIISPVPEGPNPLADANEVAKPLRLTLDDNRVDRLPRRTRMEKKSTMRHPAQASKAPRRRYDVPEKLKLLKEAADEGYIPAMHEYGMETDELEEKRRYLQMAADEGYIPAMYEYGMETDELEEKRRYLRMAAAEGYIAAKYELARLLD